MFILKVEFDMDKKYSYRFVGSEAKILLGQIIMKYDLFNIGKKFGIMRFDGGDRITKFKNMLFFYSFFIKLLNNQKVIYEIVNTGLTTKKIDDVVECFANFWN